MASGPIARTNPDGAQQVQFLRIDADPEFFLKFPDGALQNRHAVFAVFLPDVAAGPDHQLLVQRIVPPALPALEQQDVAGPVADHDDRQDLNQHGARLDDVPVFEMPAVLEAVEQRPCGSLVETGFVGEQAGRGVGRKRQDFLVVNWLAVMERIARIRPSERKAIERFLLMNDWQLDEHRFPGAVEQRRGRLGTLLKC